MLSGTGAPGRSVIYSQQTPGCCSGPDQAVEILSAIRGRYVWSVRCEEYGVSKLDFGNPHLTVRGPYSAPGKSSATASGLQRRLVVPTGMWHLFVEWGLWSVEAGGFRCSRTDEQFDARAFNQPDGQKLVSIAYNPEGAEWVFHFDLLGGLSIRSQHLEAEGDAQWMLFFEKGRCLYCEDADHIFLEQDVFSDPSTR